MLGRILILVALTLSGAATLYYLAMSGPTEAVEPPKIMVRVAARPLALGAFLEEADAPLEQRVIDATTADLVTELTPNYLGAVVIAPIAEGQPVPRAALLSPDQEGFLAAVLRPGMRAISIGVNAVSGNAGHIFPGDRVDVVLAQRLTNAGADPANAWAAETILRDVRVIAVDQRLDEDLTARSTTNVARTITLETSPRDAEKVALAANLGELSLSLRALSVEPPQAAEDATPIFATDISRVLAAQARAAKSAAQEPAASGPRPAASGPGPNESVARPVTVLRGSSASVINRGGNGAAPGQDAALPGGLPAGLSIPEGATIPPELFGRLQGLNVNSQSEAIR